MTDTIRFIRDVSTYYCLNFRYCRADDHFLGKSATFCVVAGAHVCMDSVAGGLVIYEGTSENLWENRIKIVSFLCKK